MSQIGRRSLHTSSASSSGISLIHLSLRRTMMRCNEPDNNEWTECV